MAKRARETEANYKVLEGNKSSSVENCNNLDENRAFRSVFVLADLDPVLVVVVGGSAASRSRLNNDEFVVVRVVVHQFVCVCVWHCQQITRPAPTTH